MGIHNNKIEKNAQTTKAHTNAKINNNVDAASDQFIQWHWSKVTQPSQTRFYWLQPEALW